MFLFVHPADSRMHLKQYNETLISVFITMTLMIYENLLSLNMSYHIIYFV